MSIATEELAGGITKVVLEGRLDIENSPAVDSHMAAIAGSRNTVLVDLQKVSFLGSIGLRALVAPALAITGRGGKMVLWKKPSRISFVTATAPGKKMVP
jgi:anti-sigma B factor antagonist